MRAPTGPGPLEATILTEALRARPAGFVALALAAHALLWTVARFIADPTPAPEVLIGLAVGREWRLGYLEGPPLGFWLLEIIYNLGGSFTVAYLLPPVCVAFAGWFVFAFAREVLGERHAAIAVLLMVGVHPVAFPVGAFNADLLQMPLVAATLLVWWKGVRSTSRLAPYGFALLAALLAYAGVQGLLVAATLIGLSLATRRGRDALAGLLLITKDWRAALAGRDALLAIILAMLLIAPRFVWLVIENFAGLTQGAASGLELSGLDGAVQVALQAVLGHIGLLVLFVVASDIATRDHDTAPVFVRPPVSRFARITVLAVAIVPAAAALLLGALSGAKLPVIAAGPLILLTGVLTVLIAGNPLRVHRQRAVAITALALLLLPPALDTASGLLAPWAAERGRATNFPAAAAGRYLTEVFRNRTGHRLDYVVGDARIASAVAYGSRDRPHVFIDADPRRSPWINADQLRRNGAIVVWTVTGLNPEPPAELARRLPPLTPEATYPLNWVIAGRLDPVRIGWAIIPPAP